MVNSSRADDVCLIAKVPYCGCVVGIVVIPQYVTGELNGHKYVDILRRDIMDWIVDGLDVEIAVYHAVYTTVHKCPHVGPIRPAEHLRTLSSQKLEQIDTVCEAVEVLLTLR
jgi:hypothetical protein